MNMKSQFLDRPFSLLLIGKQLVGRTITVTKSQFLDRPFSLLLHTREVSLTESVTSMLPGERRAHGRRSAAAGIFTHSRRTATMLRLRSLRNSPGMIGLLPRRLQRISLHLLMVSTVLVRGRRNPREPAAWPRQRTIAGSWSGGGSMLPTE